MTRIRNYVLAVVVVLSSVPAVFGLAYVALSRMVRLEYASGERILTAGDTVTIPAAGITAAWVVALAIGGIVVAGRRMLQRRCR